MIALTQAALIILIAFIRMRLAYLGFVFLLPFMPRYLVLQSVTVHLLRDASLLYFLSCCLRLGWPEGINLMK